MLGVTNEDCQWMRNGGAVTVPVPNPQAWIWVLGTHARRETDPLPVQLTPEQGRGAELSLGSEWSWQVVPLEMRGTPGDGQWLSFHAETAFDPGLKGYPRDLGILIRHLVILSDP